MSRSGNSRDLFASDCSCFRKSSRSSEATEAQSSGRSRKFRRRVFRAGSGCRRSGSTRARRRWCRGLGTCSGGDHETSTAADAENSGTVRRSFSGTSRRPFEELSAGRRRRFWELSVTDCRRLLGTLDRSEELEIRNLVKKSATGVRRGPWTRRRRCSSSTCRRRSPPTVASVASPTMLLPMASVTSVTSLATSAKGSIAFDVVVQLQTKRLQKSQILQMGRNSRVVYDAATERENK